MKIATRIWMMMALGATLLLGACLPEDTDPAKDSVSQGQVSGAYYASGLANLAVQIQGIISTRSDWTNFLDAGSGRFNFAALQIKNDSMGAPVAARACLQPDGSVDQIVWLDSGVSGAFKARGIGADANTILTSLAARLPENQIGTYSGNRIVMRDGTISSASCSDPAIPNGAPVVVFHIAHPQTPTVAMSRTEYRTVACSLVNSRSQRGTAVQRRTVTYQPSGVLDITNWANEDMGSCVDDVVVSLSRASTNATDNATDISSFAQISLADLLRQQMEMRCSRTDIGRTTNEGNSTRRIDTCGGSAVGQQLTAVSDIDSGNQDNRRILQCKGTIPKYIVRFNNLMLDQLGNTNITWTGGVATLVRRVENANVNSGPNSNSTVVAQRSYWDGEVIGCVGFETHRVVCDKIPGNPAPENRSSQKWDVQHIGPNSGVDYVPYMHCNSKGCNVRWTPRLIYIDGYDYKFLNPDYFKGTTQPQNSHTTTRRLMEARTWLDSRAFKPNPQPITPWAIEDNQCEWTRRVISRRCPDHYDSTRQGSWAPQTVFNGPPVTRTLGDYNSQGQRNLERMGFQIWTPGYKPMPKAMKPGIGSDGTYLGNIYSIVVQQNPNRYLAEISMARRYCFPQWGNQCVDSSETAGPGMDAFIEAWTDSPLPPGFLYLSGAAQGIRAELCRSLDWQIDRSDINAQRQAENRAAQTALQQANAANTQAQQANFDAQTQLDAINASLAAAQQHLANAQQNLAIATNDYNNAQANADANGGNMAGIEEANNNASLFYNHAYYWCNGYGGNSNTATYNCNYNIFWCQQWQATAQSRTDMMNAANSARANRDNWQNVVNDAQNQVNNLTSQQANAQNNANSAQSNANQTQNAANQAASQADATQAAADRANADALEFIGAQSTRDFTAEEVAALRQFRTDICPTGGEDTTMMSPSRQTSTQASCSAYYQNPSFTGAYNASTGLYEGLLPELGQFCNEVFTNDNGYPRFKTVNGGSGQVRQATLLNRDGVVLDYKPSVTNNNNNLEYTQDSFYEELYCALNEENYQVRPTVTYWADGNGKGNTRIRWTPGSILVTESTTREWKGYSYSSGTWSTPTRIIHSDLGEWSEWWQVPAVIVTW